MEERRGEQRRICTEKLLLKSFVRKPHCNSSLLSQREDGEYRLYLEFAETIYSLGVCLYHLYVLTSYACHCISQWWAEWTTWVTGSEQSEFGSWSAPFTLLMSLDESGNFFEPWFCHLSSRGNNRAYSIRIERDDISTYILIRLIIFEMSTHIGQTLYQILQMSYLRLTRSVQWILQMNKSVAWRAK